MNMNKNACLRLALCAAATLGAVLAAGEQAQAQRGNKLTIKGSDTMVNLSQAWADGFMKANPGTQISVTGGGSGTGMASLLGGSCDIATVSREIKAKEIADGKAKGFVPTKSTVALDGIAVAVNAGNPIKSINLVDLGKVYTGAIGDWKLIGGRPGKMVVLSRESSSGTYAFFKEHVMADQNYRSDSMPLASTKAIATEVAKNPNAMGYGGEAYFRGKAGIKVLPVSVKAGAPAVAPSDASIRSKKYPISRGLYMVTPGKPKDLAARFIAYCNSPAGQVIVGQVGFTPIK